MNKKSLPESRYVPDESAGSTRHLDLSKMRPAAFPNLKPANATISLRMPIWMLHEIKRRANQRDVPYQSFIKMMLAEGLETKPARRRVTGG
jgi:predicted DNA binding CopG/RHH family protein